MCSSPYLPLLSERFITNYHENEGEKQVLHQKPFKYSLYTLGREGW